MNRPQPRSVYVRRWLLLLAGVIALAWIILQLWPTGTDDERPTSTSTVTALPPEAPSGQPSAAAPTPAKPTTPPPPTAKVTLASGSKACNTRDVSIQPFVASPQQAQRPVFVDVAVTTSSTKPCTFTPKELDPLVVITHDGDSVWDSSICETAIVSRPVQLVPGWATTVRIPWAPRESGESCKGDEDWLEPGEYTLRVGTLGGEPGRAEFELEEPPPPPKPTPAPNPNATPGQPAPANPAPADPAPADPAPAPANNV